MKLNVSIFDLIYNQLYTFESDKCIFLPLNCFCMISFQYRHSIPSHDPIYTLTYMQASVCSGGKEKVMEKVGRSITVMVLVLQMVMIASQCEARSARECIEECVRICVAEGNYILDCYGKCTRQCTHLPPPRHHNLHPSHSKFYK